MNYRIRKKHAKPVIEICKQIKTDKNKIFWNMKIPNKSNYNLSYLSDIDAYNYDLEILKDYRKVLYKIVDKALKDNFRIQNFWFSEIIWLKFDDCIVYFHSQDETLCFYVKKYGAAIPQKIVIENNNEYLYPRKTCQEAVWNEFE